METPETNAATQAADNLLANPNAADELKATSGAKGPGRGVTIELIGGSEGPGWQGDTYFGVPIQKGIVGTFHGDAEEIQRQLEGRAGGGLYKWSGIGSDGKSVSGQFRLPGPPKQHRPDDPAAAAAFGAAFGVGAGFGPGAFGAPFPGPGFAAPPPPPAGGAGVAADPMNLPPYSWLWSAAQNRYVWFAPDGSPPPCPPPRQAPGAPAFGSFGAFGAAHGEEDPNVRALREEMKDIKALLANQANGGGSNALAALMMQGMQQQNTMMMSMFAADRQASKDRAELDNAARARQDAIQKAAWEQLQAASKVAATPAAAPTDTLRAALDKVLVAKLADAIGEPAKKKSPEDEMTTSERLGEKAIGALEKFAELGAAWLNKPATPEKKPQNGTNGAAASGSAAPAAAHHDDGLDGDTRVWINLIEVANEAYGAGRSPDTARDMIFAACKAQGADFNFIAKSLATFSSAQLLGLLTKLPESAQARVKPLADSFGTGDGRAWFDSLLDVFRKTKTES